MDNLVRMQNEAVRLLADARELALLRAFAAGKGVMTIVVPSQKTREVTSADKMLVIARRARVEELVWLHHERDAVCVETGLTPDQVAGILSEKTRKANGNGAAHAVAQVAPIWEDEAQWPPSRRRTVTAGDPSGRLMPLEDDDYAVILAARKGIPEGGDNKPWRRFRERYGAHRLLTAQQIAGAISVAKREGRLVV